MKIRQRALLLFSGLSFCLLAGIATAADDDLTVESKKASKALNAALRYFRRNPEQRDLHVPDGYTLSQKNDEIIVQYLNDEGNDKTTRLDSLRNSLSDLGNAILAYRKKRNLIRVYRLLYKNIPRKFRRRLAKPGALNKLGLREVQRQYKKLSRKLRNKFPRILDMITPGILLLEASNPIGSCASEVGYETAGTASEVSDRCSILDYNANGLFTNIDFPLKEDITCIKDQGRRGTCVAHAIAATVESLELVGGGAAENLSEQHLYYRGEVDADSLFSPTQMQIYGLSSTLTLDQLVALNRRIVYESDWNYNQSSSIGNITIDGDGTLKYPTSCVSYSGESCTTYAFQTTGIVPLAGVVTPDPPPTGSAVHHILTHSVLPNDGIGGIVTASSLQAAIVLLAADIPLVISVNVTDSFQNTTDGYVRFNAGDTIAGGHAMELVGFVPNSELPAGATDATEEGYFITKNSWGIDSGDCGFYYLDYGYVRQYLRSLSIITID